MNTYKCKTKHGDMNKSINKINKNNKQWKITIRNANKTKHNETYVLFSSRGIRTTPQHTDSHPCTRPGMTGVVP